MKGGRVAYIAGWVERVEGTSALVGEPYLHNLKSPSVFITGRAFRECMGREIITISVPSGSKVLEILNAWKQDPNANLSANVCAAIHDKGDIVTKLRSLQRRHKATGELLRTRTRGLIPGGFGKTHPMPTETGKMTMEEWQDLYGFDFGGGEE